MRYLKPQTQHVRPDRFANRNRSAKCNVLGLRFEVALLSALCFLLCPNLHAVSVSLTVQSASFPGSVDPATLSWSQDPLTMGIPFADHQVTDASQLGVSGAGAYQFRVLGRWPSGSVKWALMDAIVDGPGSISVTGGPGSSGGASLATDNGGTITINTGAATFTIKKANFNGIDSVVMGGQTLVASSNAQTRGLVITGPTPGQTACPPCVTIYSSANDPNSNVTLEENGPAKAVIRAVGNHMDSSGHPYMQYTARLYFYQGKSSVKATVVLRNANYDTSATPSPDAGGGTFNTAFKGFQAYELRIAAGLNGPLNYTIATDAASPATGTLNNNGTDSASIYQGQSMFMSADTVEGDFCDPGSACANNYTPDQGYVVKQNGATKVSGGINSVIGGWADISDSAGAGLEIGMYQMSAYWPGSLEFDNGGTDVRIGIFPSQNGKAVYMPWPQWNMHQLFLNFHATALPSPSNDFLKYQHFLLARAPYQYYNSTNVFPYPIIDPGTEDNYYVTTGQQANPTMAARYFCFAEGADGACTPDRGTNNENANSVGMGLGVVREYPWGEGGSTNQLEVRWGDMLRFLQRGQTGRFLNSKHFYEYMVNYNRPHADGTSPSDSRVNAFTWRSRPDASHGQELDGWGGPAPVQAKAANESLGFGLYAEQLASNGFQAPQWPDTAHDHWYGMLDYFFLTGDQTVQEAIVPRKDLYMNQGTYMWNGGLTYTRAFGTQLTGASRFSEYLAAIGDPDAGAVLGNALNNFNNYVNVPGCEGGLVNGVQKWYPAGCTPPPFSYQSNDPYGISQERGNHQAPFRGGSGWCGTGGGGVESGLTGQYRFQNSFYQSILEQGLLELRRVEGPSWVNYQRALDLAFGLSQWSFNEAFIDDGQTHWAGSNALNSNGFAYSRVTDMASVCPPNTTVDGSVIAIGGKIYDGAALALGMQNIYFNFYVQSLVNGVTPDFERRFKIALDQTASGTSVWPGEFGMFSVSNNIGALSNPNATALINVSTSGFHDNGSGSYTVSWTPPAGVQSYVLRWGTKFVVDSLQFDSLYTNSFGLSPDVYQNWWTANLVANPPAASATSFTFTGLPSGLTFGNFSVKAYVPSSSLPHTNPPLLTNGAPTSPPPLPSGTQQATLSLNTNVSATCKYATTPGVAYSAMTNSFMADSNGTTQTASVTGLSDGNGYPYYVRCQDTQGNTNPVDYLIYFQVGPGQVVPPAPGSVVVTPGNGQVTVGWTTVSNATSYNIYWVAGINDPKTGMMQVSNNSPSVVTGLTNGTLYTFAVTAVNSVGESIESAKVTSMPSAAATPPPGGNPPQGPVTPGQTLSVRVYPNPWRSDKHGLHPSITFDGLVGNTTIKLFTVSGHKVKELSTSESKIDWDLTNDAGDKVASGVYLYVITDSQGDKVKGKVAVIK